MEVSCVAEEAWVAIAWVQLGDPLAHGREGLLYCARSDSLTTLARSAPVSEGKDEQVADLELILRSVCMAEFIGGRGDAEIFAEVFPDGEYSGLGISRPSCSGSLGHLERSAEVSKEAVCSLSVSSRQGCGCG